MLRSGPDICAKILHIQIFWQPIIQIFWYAVRALVNWRCLLVGLIYFVQILWYLDIWEFSYSNIWINQYLIYLRHWVIGRACCWAWYMHQISYGSAAYKCIAENNQTYHCTQNTQKNIQIFIEISKYPTEYKIQN